MENPMFWLISLIAGIIIYRLLARRHLTPKARVTAMLRRYRALEKTGLSERDCLLQTLVTRNGWEKFLIVFSLPSSRGLVPRKT